MQVTARVLCARGVWQGSINQKKKMAEDKAKVEAMKKQLQGKK